MPEFLFTNTANGVLTKINGSLPLETAGLLQPGATYTVQSLSTAAAQPITVPSSAGIETNMLGHWLLGGDTASLTDLNGTHVMTPGASGAGATFDSNAVRIQGMGAGYLTDIDDAPNFTFALVVQRTSVNSIFGGTFTPADNAPGWVSYAENTELQYNSRSSGLVTVENNTQTDWMFIATSMDSSGNRLLFRGDRTASVAVTNTQARGAIAPEKIALGGSNFDVAFSNDFKCAELMVSHSYTNLAEMEAIYQRSILRLQDRSITLA